MNWGDVTLCVDSDGHQYLEFTERQTKTRQGDNPPDARAVTPKMWANMEKPDQCPINMYKYYAGKRPSDDCKPEDPFYIATHTNVTTMRENDQWFKRQPIGTNKLTSLIKKMSAAAGLSADKKLTNHSARNHLVQTLVYKGVPPNTIVQYTGHRNLQSVNNYSHMNEDTHKQISRMLSNPSGAGNANPITLVAANLQNNIVSNTCTSMTSDSKSATTWNFHGNLHSQSEKSSSKPPKRRRIIESDSESQ